MKKTILKILPYALIILALAIYNSSISYEAVKGESPTMRTVFITIEIIIPLVGSILALRLEKSKINRFLFAMLGFFGGFLISLDLFVISLIRNAGK